MPPTISGKTAVRQLIWFTLVILSMTGLVTMLGISRWTYKMLPEKPDDKSLAEIFHKIAASGTIHAQETPVTAR